MSAKGVVEQPKKRRISRRQFLIAAGVGGAALVVGVPTVGVPFARLKLAQFIEESGGPPGGFKVPPMAWFEISPANRVRVFIPKVEMGQGIHTALAQIAAEELDVSWEQVEVRQAATGQELDDPVGTSASNSISSLYTTLRQVGATVRGMLLAEAARQTGRPVADLKTRDGVVYATGPDLSLTYGEIVSQAQGWTVPDPLPQLKPDSELRYIGQPVPRVDLQAKVLGQAAFGIDVRLPGMAYGAVAHPPTLEGKLKRAAEGQARTLPGVIAVLIEGDFAGVVAERRDQAYAALAALEIEWEPGRAWQQAELEALVTVGRGNGVTIQNEGDAGAALKAGQPITAEYRTPFAYQAHREPQTAVADVRADGVTVYASTQSAVRVRGHVAKAIGRDEKDVVVQPAFLGGGFGHKVLTTAAVEAARLSVAAGRPVQIVWNRADDFTQGFLRPMTHHVLAGTVGTDGRIAAMEHRQASGAVALPFLPGIAAAVMGADFGAWRGALIPYNVADKRTIAWVAKLPVPTGWWRGLGLLANSFALESFMDELAYAAKVDPLEFRLRNVPAGPLGERMQAALGAAAQAAGWGSAPPAGRGRGIACTADVGTVVAAVAEVAIEGGQIRVHRMTAAVDPGRVINPDGAVAQVQGNIIMGLSSALEEEATVKDGALEALNFGAYRLLTMAAAPQTEVVLLGSGTEPRGLGEPPIAPIAPAVANAVFALTGQRLRRLPLRLG